MNLSRKIIRDINMNEEPKTKPVVISPDLAVGGDNIIMMSGPCAVESYEQLHEVAEVISQNGCRVLRGGAFKPRTSPYSFQGIGLDGLKMLRAVADEFGLLVITEALSVKQIVLVEEYADIIQIGSRNMQHFPILWSVGEIDKPVLLKRGFMSTIEEWLSAAEHIAHKGNEKIILCERGIRSFDTATRFTLDINAISLVKLSSHFPVIADPSHATGRSDIVLSVACAAIAAGVDGLLVEFHPQPCEALCDAAQAIPLATFPFFLEKASQIACAVGRKLV